MLESGVPQPNLCRHCLCRPPPPTCPSPPPEHTPAPRNSASGLSWPIASSEKPLLQRLKDMSSPILCLARSLLPPRCSEQNLAHSRCSANEGMVGAPSQAFAHGNPTKGAPVRSPFRARHPEERRRAGGMGRRSPSCSGGAPAEPGPLPAPAKDQKPRLSSVSLPVCNLRFFCTGDFRSRWLTPRRTTRCLS